MFIFCKQNITPFARELKALISLAISQRWLWLRFQGLRDQMITWLTFELWWRGRLTLVQLWFHVCLIQRWLMPWKRNSIILHYNTNTCYGNAIIILLFEKISVIFPLVLSCDSFSIKYQSFTIFSNFIFSFSIKKLVSNNM